MMLTILGNLLVKYYRSKMEISLRVASLDYLGTITARLRRDRVAAMQETSFEKTRLDLVVKGILYDEFDDPAKTLEEIDTSNVCFILTLWIVQIEIFKTQNWSHNICFSRHFLSL